MAGMEPERAVCQCPKGEWGKLRMEDIIGTYHGGRVYETYLAQGGHINDATDLGYTFLFAACTGGQVELVKDLLTHDDLHLNVVNRWGMTPLMVSLKMRNEGCARVLLTAEHKCRLDLSLRDREGLTALSYAARKKRWDVIPLLVQPHTHYDAQTIDITLYKVVEGGLWDVVLYLLQRYHDFEGDTISRVLFRATKANNTKIVRLILKVHHQALTYEDLVAAKDVAADYKFYDIERVLRVELDQFLHQHAVTSDSRVINRDLMAMIRPDLRTPRRESGHRPDEVRGEGTIVEAFFPGDEEGFLRLEVVSVKRAVPPGPDTYDTTTTPRGIVIILNYHNFRDRPDMVREGSHMDVANLKNLCGQMGYETQVLCDLTKEDTMSSLVAFRNQEKLKHVGCSIVAVMSHGIDTQTFYTADMGCVSVRDVLSLFLDNECPNLKGKPKIFLYNFCRGIDVPAPCLETDAVRTQPRDMMCLYSTTESFLSYRDRRRGCPFVIALCEVLAAHAHHMDLDNLIRKFQQVYLPSSTPEIQNLGFQKRFFFNPIGRRHNVGINQI